MLAIRLSRVGKKNFPFFRVVVMDKRKSAKGRALEVLGSVNPRNKEVVLKTERLQYWLGVGAEASDRVYNILVSQKILEGKKHPKKIRAKKKEDKEAETAPAAAATADKLEAAEEPKESKSEENPVEKTAKEEETEELKKETKPEEKKPEQEKSVEEKVKPEKTKKEKKLVKEEKK